MGSELVWASTTRERSPAPELGLLVPSILEVRSMKPRVHMRAAVYTAYGAPETLRWAELPVPVPAPGELCVRVRAAPVTAGDARMRSGEVPRGLGLLFRAAIGWRRPRGAPGWAFAGEVVAVGPGAGTPGSAQFAVGQRVFGIQGIGGGAHREFLTIRADGLVLPLPESLSFEQGAAFFFGGLTAAQALLDETRVAPGEAVLVSGATGSVGSAAVQIACHQGATVTALASPQNHALALRLGAKAVQDYRLTLPPGPFDVIVDVMGTIGWARARPLLRPNGRLVLITAGLADMLGAALRPKRRGRRVIASTNRETLAAMRRLVELHTADAYTPELGRIFPFADLAEAHALADSFHKPGNIVVTMT